MLFKKLTPIILMILVPVFSLRPSASWAGSVTLTAAEMAAIEQALDRCIVYQEKWESCSERLLVSPPPSTADKSTVSPGLILGISSGVLGAFGLGFLVGFVLAK